MDILGFLAGVADNFRNHYLRLADQVLQGSRREQTTVDNQAPARTADTYEPSVLPADNQPAETADSPAQDTADLGDTEPSTEAPQAPEASATPAEPDASEDNAPQAETNPDGTYFVTRRARLDYRLDLSFDLAAMQRTVAALSEGDSSAVEILSAAGMGLSAALNIQGFEQTESGRAATGKPDGPAGHLRGADMVKARQAGAFAANSRNFALDSFFNESAKLMRSHSELARNGYKRAVNRFALRYRMDTGFSFAFLERFNLQTEQVAEQAPDSLQSYVNSAGAVAESASGDMMTAFFDAVDAYLNAAEDQLIEKAAAFFDQAAGELGFSGAMVDAARDHLTGSIESFFGRVDDSMAQIRTRFVGAETAQPQSEAQAPVAGPETASQTEELAVA